MKTIQAIAALWLAIPATAYAGPYVEIGVSAMSGCLVDYDEKLRANGCSNNPFGLLAVGYEWNGLALEIEHRSSLVEKDEGLNALTLKYRWEWK